jgi:hypothetical protein
MFAHRLTGGRAARVGLFLGAAALLSTVSSACAQSSSQPARTPVEQAAFMERTRCSADDDEKALAPVIAGAALESVHPLYAATTRGKTGVGSELRGVVMTVAAPAGVTDVWLDRALECHSARATLGHIPTASQDPFWLPGSTVDIDVRANKDGFDIVVSGYSSEDAASVFARAEAFARARNAAPPRNAEATR